MLHLNINKSKGAVDRYQNEEDLWPVHATTPDSIATWQRNIARRCEELFRQNAKMPSMHLLLMTVID